MQNFKLNSKLITKSTESDSEKGAALVIAIMVMLLLAAFVTLVVSRVSSETVITGVDSSENRAVAATMASLESTTRDFADVFVQKLSPTAQDITNVSNKPMPITELQTNYTFTKNIAPPANSVTAEITDGPYSGLYALRDEYEVDITSTENSTGIQTQLKRRFNNDRIPLFQFGIFFEDDLELNRPPLFTFGGRVHTNQNFFVTAGSGGIYFKSKATAVGELVNDIWKTRSALTNGTDNISNVWVTDAAGSFQQLVTGRASVRCVNPTGANVFGTPGTPLYNPNLPPCSRLTTWNADKAVFQGNLETNAPRLDLPLFRLGITLNELIKRSKNVGDQENVANVVGPVTPLTQDSTVLSRERFGNKEGLRISLADSRDGLPGCVGVPVGNPCGVQLDGALASPTGPSVGYVPMAMQDGYQATALNATRFAQTGKQIWIKVEMVNYDFNAGVPITTDVTQDFLSLGVTERAPIRVNAANGLEIQGYSDALNPNDVNDPDNDDSRSIIKLQRFTIPGGTSPGTVVPNTSVVAGNAAFYVSNRVVGSAAGDMTQNLVVRYTGMAANVSANPQNGCTPNANLPGGPPPVPNPNYCGIATNAFSVPMPRNSENFTSEDNYHLKAARWTNAGAYTDSIVPFPIQLFDTRESIPRETNADITAINANNVTSAGVMSLVDIDVANLRKFFNGDYNNLFPVNTPYAVAKGGGLSLLNTDVPSKSGWVLFVSDRRGDADFDGEYDMEDVFPDGELQYNEDVNENTFLERSLFNAGAPANPFEAPTSYADSLPKGQAATSDHGFYRRGVRLINGTVIPGTYNSVNKDLTQGFTVASENGVYVLGNYNATGVTLTGNNQPAPAANYLPQGSATHIPAAIVSDAITILSNNWNDAKSFRNPFTQEDRVATATQVRFAMLAGDGITGNTTIAYNPSGFGQLNGGIHNFKRFLEQWTSVRLNYTGSLVNLFNSRNNNGYWKCCNSVYNPPIRDWSFDTTFTDPKRLPPGTPYIYSLTFTGFQRVNE